MTRAEQNSRLRFARVRMMLGERCASRSSGRILLHVAACLCDRQYRWHWRGITRELCN